VGTDEWSANYFSWDGLMLFQGSGEEAANAERPSPVYSAILSKFRFCIVNLFKLIRDASLYFFQINQKPAVALASYGSDASFS